MREVEDVAKSLISAIIIRAVKDWIALDYGEIKAFRESSNTIHRKEVYEFLISPEFEVMIRFIAPGVKMENVWKTLRVYGGEDY